MKYYRSVVLAAAFAGALALPALAQTPAPDAPAPQAQAASPMPDAGVKKTAPGAVRHVHHTGHHKAARPARAK